ncbi:MAG TPA: signal peptidase I [Planctomycetota bacterium]|nr:signal peptidase I [Planctomycetota bacterium]
MSPAASEPVRAARPRRSLVRRLLRWAERTLALCGLAFIVYHVGFDLSAMSSDSMSPALAGTNARNGDWVLTEKVSYWFRRPRRWEVVTFLNDDGLQVMKRVAGLPGERVGIREDRVVVDGAEPPRPERLARLRHYAYGSLHKGAEAACGDGYFVLGDNTADSLDSRYEGPVRPDSVVGRAWLVVWPPEKAGFVGP